MAATEAAAPTGRSRWQAWWMQQWFGPNRPIATALLRPFSRLYEVIQRHDRQRRERQAQTLAQPACPVVVVGNLVVGGAGKTPATVAIVLALQAAGRRPGVVSRGYGRSSHADHAVSHASDPADSGDEPLLIHRRTGAPVQVGQHRVAAAQRLLAAHPKVDVIVADDGLQHRQLRRDVDVIVFDERGTGNGMLLPVGPLREPFGPAPPAGALVLYNHVLRSTEWPGYTTQRRLQSACPLADWLVGRRDRMQPLTALRGRPLLALAGIAVPERFFAALRSEGLTIDPAPRPDHASYPTLPWPPGTPEVVTTEKDAVKLAPYAGTASTVWVVGLDLTLPADFVATLLARLPPSVES